jgi:hypothetical protein
VRELESQSSSMYHGSYRIGNALSAFSNTTSLDLDFFPSGSSSELASHPYGTGKLPVPVQ